MVTEVIGAISAIHRGALHDGPGLRTTVFLQGCHLRCVWCHNPETWAAQPRLAWVAADCLGCGGCSPACPRDLLPKGPRSAPAACDACAACTTACPSGALLLQGSQRSVSSVMGEVLRDAASLRQGGGLTLSGGEPLDQPAFTAALLGAAGEAGLRRCLDTSGDAPQPVIVTLIPLVDCWLLDWKCADDQRHRQLTGIGNARIRATLDLLDAAGAAIWLRCPLIPGLNDDEAHLASIAALSQRPSIQRVEIMPFHRHGLGKAQANGHQIYNAPSSTPTQVATWRSRLQAMDCQYLHL